MSLRFYKKFIKLCFKWVNSCDYPLLQSAYSFLRIAIWLYRFSSVISASSICFSSFYIFYSRLYIRLVKVTFLSFYLLATFLYFFFCPSSLVIFSLSYAFLIGNYGLNLKVLLFDFSSIVLQKVKGFLTFVILYRA